MRILKNIFSAIIFVILITPCIKISFADNYQTKNSFLSANQIEYHNEISLISAIGDVEIINGSDILKADKISYDMESDKILATGNVSLEDKNNNIFFSDKMELQGDLKKAVIKNFTSLLSDGSRLSANTITRDSNEGDKLEKITFTRCEPCKEDKNDKPIWQLRALKSERNVEKGLIAYQNVLFDVFGLPILYIPYISHADPSTKAKSGLLSPKFNNNTVFGFSYSQPYYIALSKNNDLTLTPTITTNEGPILETEYRKLRAKGSTFINHSITRGSHTNIDGKESNKIRGHIEVKVAERLNSNWVAGINAIRASDFSYIGRYKIKNIGENNLVQKAYLNGRYKNLYTNIKTMYFQPLDAFKSNRHVPLILPDISLIWNEKYNNGVSREVKLHSAMIAKGDASNMQKMSLETNWSKKNIFSSGQLLDLNFSIRGDIYKNKKTDNSRTIGEKGSHTSFRAIPKIDIKWSFPFINYESKKITIIEPIIQTIISPKGGNPDKIHNLDSIDIELNDLNLFSSNRFSGYDKIEEGSRINFGIKSDIITKNIGSLKTLIGRSYSPLKPQNEKIDGTGLNKKLSDIVGHIIYNYEESLSLSYKFRKNSLISQRDTLSMNFNSTNFSTNIDYTMIKDDPVPSQSLISEQLHLNLTWRVNDNWSANISQRRDLKDSNYGNATHSKGYLEYKNECIIIRLSADRQHGELIDIPDTTEYSLNFKLVSF